MLLYAVSGLWFLPRSTLPQVKKITSDIKQLDNAKRHLTDSVRTLERLRFLITNLEDLQ